MAAQMVDDDITMKSINLSKDSDSNRDDCNYDQDFALMPEELLEVPTYKYTENCPSELIEETRELLRKRFELIDENSYYQSQLDLFYTDDWSMSRFLLRCRLNPERACNLIVLFTAFQKEYRMSEAKYHHFPKELFKMMTEFIYEPDIAGNITLWIRVRGHRRVPELFELVKKYIMCVATDCDMRSNGRGTTLIIDCTDAGYKSADPQLLYWSINTFRNIFPKGLTYVLLVNLPRTLKTILELATVWMSNTNKKKLRFANKEEIFKYIPKNNVPKYLGGTCQLEPNRYNYINEVMEPARVIEDKSHPVPLSELEVKTLQHYYKKVCNRKNPL